MKRLAVRLLATGRLASGLVLVLYYAGKTFGGFDELA
jgi:hypothetical protein